MVHVHRISGQALYVNAAHIVTVEPTPDTLLHLTDGSRLLVREQAEVVCAAITRWFAEVGRGAVVPNIKPADLDAEPKDD